MASIPYSPASGVVITGAASGIGRACAQALAAAGRPVALWDRNEEGARSAARDIASRHGVAALGQRVDMRTPGQFPAAVEQSLTTLGSLGALVHCAGVVDEAAPEQLDEASWAAVLDVNLRAQALLVQSMLSSLRAAKGAAVVGISSIEGIVGHAMIPAYCASKSGLIGLTRSLADHLAQYDIRVNAVCPGFIQTPMIAPVEANEQWRTHTLAQIPLQRFGQAEEIAQAVRFLLGDDASYITGATLVVDGGITAVRR